MHLIRTKPPGMQASINRCLSQTRTNWEGCGRKGIRRKMEEGDGDGGEVSLDGVPLSPLSSPAPQNPETMMTRKAVKRLCVCLI